MGVCIGLLAAAVASFAESSAHIVTLGLECVAMSFRIGLHLRRRSRLVEDSPKSWGCTIVGMNPDSLQRRLDRFNEGLPAIRHAYPGVVANNWSTIFAPPSSMEHLLASPGMSDVPKTRLPSAIGVHAGHLPKLDANALIGDCSFLDMAISDKLSLRSCSTCEPYAAKDLRSLFTLIVEDISERPLHLESTLKRAALSFQDAQSATIIPVGPTHMLAMAQKELSRKLRNVKTWKHSYVDTAGARSGSESIAIVGMSGKHYVNLKLSGLSNIVATSWSHAD